jgi:hypothetical protein
MMMELKANQVDSRYRSLPSCGGLVIDLYESTPIGTKVVVLPSGIGAS